MERVMSEIAMNFSLKSNIESHIVLYDNLREIFYHLPENVIIHTPSFRFNNKLRLYFTLKTLFFLRNTIRKIKPASVLSLGEYWNSFVLLSLLGLNYPVFVSDRSQPDKSLGIFHNLLRHLLYRTAKGLIFQTEKAKDIYLSKLKHPNVAVIGNPIRQFDSSPPPKKREKLVLMVGRLIRTKNQDTLIEIFAKINHPDWKLVIVGYDHLKQHHLVRLKRLAEELNVEKKVIFLDKTDNVEEIYSRSSIFAFTSSSEGFPNAIGEAMAAGLPVVAFDCIAGPSEMVIDGRTGFLVPMFDYDLFELRLSQLMNDENLREIFGANAREHIRTFSPDKICLAFYEFITS